MSSFKQIVPDYDEPIEYPESDGKPLGKTDRHRQLIFDLIHALTAFYLKVKDVYISGDLMMYYEEGNPEKVISPDVFVVKGVEKGERRTYQTWVEGKMPDVVIEVSSRKTKREDFTTKMELYARLGVKEYYIFNPEYPKRRPAFNTYRLSGKQFVDVLITGGRVKSKILELELVDTGKILRLFNPQTQEFFADASRRGASIAGISRRDCSLARNDCTTQAAKVKMGRFIFLTRIIEQCQR
jgi:Uma2 family endonuclease